MATAKMGKARLAKLLKQLEAHALGEGNLSATQIRAIELLLRKDGDAGPSAGKGEGSATKFCIEYRIVCPKCRELHSDPGI
ncbi:hypothetical protein [Sphingomonas parva]|uniref:hypothetical protein n=1 Tax=Sphingomonas parva TaxID=2555898 RepID=UPI001CDB6D6E|nr:hypothetical protein [Sphingomonas parva]